MKQTRPSSLLVARANRWSPGSGNHDGTLLMSIGGNGKEHGQFYLPAGIWTDRRDRVYVADMFNGRVEIFQYLGDS